MNFIVSILDSRVWGILYNIIAKKAFISALKFCDSQKSFNSLREILCGQNITGELAVGLLCCLLNSWALTTPLPNRVAKESRW